MILDQDATTTITATTIILTVFLHFHEWEKKYDTFR